MLVSTNLWKSKSIQRADDMAYLLQDLLSIPIDVFSALYGSR
jgi:hypothetical protein